MSAQDYLELNKQRAKLLTSLSTLAGLPCSHINEARITNDWLEFIAKELMYMNDRNDVNTRSQGGIV